MPCRVSSGWDTLLEGGPAQGYDSFSRRCRPHRRVACLDHEQDLNGKTTAG